MKLKSALMPEWRWLSREGGSGIPRHGGNAAVATHLTLAEEECMVRWFAYKNCEEVRRVAKTRLLNLQARAAGLGLHLSLSSPDDWLGDEWCSICCGLAGGT